MTRAASRVEVRRLVHAPVEKVFAAFASSAMVARWLRPSPDVQLSVLDFDFREGGGYRFAYDVPGGHRMVVGGTYRRIEPPHCIVFSWLIEPPDEHAGVDTEVTISLQPRDGATALEIRHEKWDRPDAESRHAIGWQGAIELLAAWLEQGAA